MATQNYSVTIIIPMFCVELSLEETLESIVRQTYRNWKCILVDDGSSDNTINIANRYAETFPDVKVVERGDSHPKGANACRNIGLKLSTTPWVMFVDADDKLSIDCLSTRMAVIENNTNKADMWVFQTAIMDQAGNIRGKFRIYTTEREDLICRFVKHDIPWQTMSIIWKKKYLVSIGAWDENYERLQDVELHIRALVRKSVIYVSMFEPDSFYRLGEMTPQKTSAALYGFTKLIKDYFILLTEDEKLRFSSRVIISKAFSQQIIHLVLTYTSQKEVDMPWCKLFLRTLKDIRLKPEIITHIGKLLSDFNEQNRSKK